WLRRTRRDLQGQQHCDRDGALAGSHHLDRKADAPQGELGLDDELVHMKGCLFGPVRGARCFERQAAKHSLELLAEVRIALNSLHSLSSGSFFGAFAWSLAVVMNAQPLTHPTRTGISRRGPCLQRSRQNSHSRLPSARFTINFARQFGHFRSRYLLID